MFGRQEAPSEKSHRGVPVAGELLPLPALPEQRSADAAGLRLLLRLSGGDVRSSLPGGESGWTTSR